MTEIINFKSPAKGIVLTINPLTKKVDFKMSGLTLFECMDILIQTELSVLKIMYEETKRIEVENVKNKI